MSFADLKTKLYPFQREGVCAIQGFDGRALVADDPGLGKTIQAIAYRLRFLRKEGPTVVVCPANIKYNWQKELWKHARLRGEVLESRTPRRVGSPFAKNGIYVINYQILKQWTKWLKSIEPVLVIIDEAHNLQNRQAQQTRATKKLCKGVPHVIALSGTALTAMPAQLWPVLNILDAEYWGTFPEFASQYCDLKKKPWGWEYHGAVNLKNLNMRLKENCMIRRRKADVLKDLPPKTRIIVPVDIEKPAVYRAAHDDFVKWLKANDWMNASRALLAERMNRTTTLHRMVCELKRKAVIEWLKDYLDVQSAGKLIFFGWHHKMLKPVYEAFKGRCVGVDGGVTGEKRQAAVDRFTNDPKTRLFAGQLKATCEGWPGQAADAVAFGELYWRPGLHTQGEDRPHRIGQKNAVFCYYLIARGTIEEDVMKKLEKYQTTVSTVLDGGAGDGDLSLFTDLMKTLGANA